MPYSTQLPPMVGSPVYVPIDLDDTHQATVATVTRIRPAHITGSIQTTVDLIDSTDHPLTRFLTDCTPLPAGSWHVTAARLSDPAHVRPLAHGSSMALALARAAREHRQRQYARFNWPHGPLGHPEQVIVRRTNTKGITRDVFALDIHGRPHKIHGAHPDHATD
ncbi:hypothetical protein [Streptomyces sp. TR02-1]|uniref:hypothetical protein n=1 Tax=Streptomyces sp. TR02-1 TaxID=3385977 RepID=UPI0039A25531